MTGSSRRGFLKIASATAAAAAVARSIPAWADTTQATGPVQVWSTFRDRRHAAADPLAWKPAVQVASDAIALDPGATRQQILGFGAALTDASCYLLSQLHDDDRAALMREIFDPGEMALNVCRTCIGSSDYSRSVYSFDDSDQDDPELKNFSIDHDKAYILPVLRDARKLNPDLFLFSSPWSPPGWMKSNRSMLGGAMRKPSFAPYADYFVKFLAAYRDAGVAIDAVTVQNEVDTDQDGRMSACLWGQEYEIGFVRDHLGPALRKQGGTTKIWILDHNYNLWGRAIDELSDAGVYEFVDGVAWHGYVGEPGAMTRVHEAFPQRNSYWTEGGPDLRSPDYQTDWAKWGHTFNGIVNNWARSITAWNMALDEEGRPNVGPFSCGGLVTIENATHKVTRSGQFWAIAHYSKHVRRGAVVFRTDGLAASSTQSSASTVSHVGFRNPDGSKVVVLTNTGEERQIQLLLGSSALEVELPADSVLTLQWS